jgi:hypothetical protein
MDFALLVGLRPIGEGGRLGGAEDGPSPIRWSIPMQHVRPAVDMDDLDLRKATAGASNPSCSSLDSRSNPCRQTQQELAQRLRSKSKVGTLLRLR